MCKALNFTCQICKKIGHYTSLCKTLMPERRKTFAPRQENRNIPQQQIQQTRRVRHIKEQQQEDETVDREAAFYIKDLMED